MAWQDLPPSVKWGLVPYTRGFGIEVNCGPHRTFPHFIGVDRLPNVQLMLSQAKPDMVVETVKKLPFSPSSLDFIFAPAHPEGNHEVAYAEWWKALKTGGYLCTFGMPELDVKGWDLVEDGELKVYKKLHWEKNAFSCKKEKPKKTAAVVRYGAFGDMVQTSSILPGLKAQGFHVTLYCAPKGYDVVKHDPHVDRFVIQDVGQVPNNGELGQFWDFLKTQYTKFVNLSESVEGSLLAMPGRVAHEWPHELRHALMDVNYLEMTHGVAQVPFPARQKFYPSGEEKSWATRERQKIGGDFTILWTLSGSSVHKSWPYLDQIIARLLVTRPNCRIVLAGDELCQILESGWEAEPRVIRRSGVWSIRETLSFLEVCDLIVGPETGVMNAAGFLSVPKICTLSHSSVENLTKHWVNCTSLTPKNTSCYPCHIMHYSFEHCRRDEKTGTAACQADISVEVMWDAIKQSLDNRKAA